MCVACREFIKETLTFKEFQAALAEVTRTDPAEGEEHLREVEYLLRGTDQDDQKLREKLRKLAPSSS